MYKLMKTLPAVIVIPLAIFKMWIIGDLILLLF